MIRFFVVGLIFVLANACSTSAPVIKDSNIIKFNYARSSQKIALGIGIFQDARKVKPVGGLATRSVMFQTLTQFSEDILVKEGIFASTRRLSAEDAGSIVSGKGFEVLRDKFNLDYVLIGKVEKADVIKSKKKLGMGHAAKMRFNYGFVPEEYEYNAVIQLSVVLYSTADGKIIWSGSGESTFEQGDMTSAEEVFYAAMQNALGRVFSKMSDVFTIKVKEIN